MNDAARPGPPRQARRLLLTAAGLSLAAVATGLAFGGWFTHGARILAVMAESGLSWCL